MHFVMNTDPDSIADSKICKYMGFVQLCERGLFGAKRRSFSSYLQPLAFSNCSTTTNNNNVHLLLLYYY